LTSGTAPSLPPSGWKVLYKDALTGWLTGTPQPSVLLVTAVAEWISGCQAMGPPPDAERVEEDLYVAMVPETRITITYVVVPYEFLVIIKKVA
jgi:hypothetical protein